MDTFVINLDRSTDRLREFQHVNAHLKPVKRFSAVDGTKVDRAELARQGLFAEPIIHTDGNLGNTLSHFRLWDMAAESEDGLTVLEDDAIIHRDYETLAPQLIAQLPADWDFVMWGWNFDAPVSFDLYSDSPCLVHFSQSDLRQRWQSVQQDSMRPSLHRFHYAFGMVGYSISKAGARKLKALMKPMAPFLCKIPMLGLQIQNVAIDCTLVKYYDQIKAYVCFPPLVFTKNERAFSTVQQFDPAKEGEEERSFKLTVASDYLGSRKYKRKHARYLFKNGDIFGGMLWYEIPRHQPQDERPLTCVRAKFLS